MSEVIKMELKELRLKAELTQQGMSEVFEIPKRTIENWEAGTRKCPVYVEKLIKEKLEGIIMMNATEILKKAMEMDEFNNSLPQLEVGETCTLAEVWDGEGEAPTDSYSYKLNDNDWFNYEFEVLEEKEEALKTVIKITNMKLI